MTIEEILKSECDFTNYSDVVVYNDECIGTPNFKEIFTDRIYGLLSNTIYIHCVDKLGIKHILKGKELVITVSKFIDESVRYKKWSEYNANR